MAATLRELDACSTTTGATKLGQVHTRCAAACPSTDGERDEERSDGDDGSPPKTQCAVCLDSVTRDDAAWECRACFMQLHLGCIQSWAQSSMRSQGSIRIWNCPQCRKEFLERDFPVEYRCFCGKVRNPPKDTWLEPHSCGNLCERSLRCGHACSLLCHAGPCPPCRKTVSVSCHCGRQSTRLPCGNEAFSCERRCNAELEIVDPTGCLRKCGHQCPRRCHAGPHPPCMVPVDAPCQCGAETRKRPCSGQLWQCGNVCDKCGSQCHRKGRLPRTCPCGSTTHTLRCDESAPLCAGTCHKLLSCGKHTCEKPCHHGDCGACSERVRVQCRCGHRTVVVPCGSEDSVVECGRKCDRWLPCGRHRCKQKCCPGNCGLCRLPCGATLDCGRHKCTSYCGQPCPPCPLRQTLRCPCGKTTHRVRCKDVPSDAVGPLADGSFQVDTLDCPHPCPVPRTCGHRDDPRSCHPCHSGPCPACTLPCGLRLFRCDHPCPAPCHAGDPCPPCRVMVDRPCVGGHTTQSMPCSAPALFQCDQPCGNWLECGKHSCSQPCHAIPRSDEATSGRDELLPCCPCDKQCESRRDCVHPCPRKHCHKGPCPACPVSLRVACFCGGEARDVACQSIVHAASQAMVAGEVRFHGAEAPIARHHGYNAVVVTATRPGSLPGEVLGCLPPYVLERFQLPGEPLVWQGVGVGNAVEQLLQCQRICGKPLNHCSHKCRESCHPGQCPAAASESCERHVTLRCRCGKRREEASCGEAQRRRRTLGKSASVGNYVLLPCDLEGVCAPREMQAPEHVSEQESNAARLRNTATKPAPSRHGTGEVETRAENAVEDPMVKHSPWRLLIPAAAFLLVLIAAAIVWFLLAE